MIFISSNMFLHVLCKNIMFSFVMPSKHCIVLQLYCISATESATVDWWPLSSEIFDSHGICLDNNNIYVMFAV